MSLNKQDAISFINKNNLIEIKAGKERETFIEIWMVVVNDRIFARSWSFAERSWYNTFLIDFSGQIKCGNNIYNIRASIPDSSEKLIAEINKAYLDKYNFGRNAQYAQGIIRQEHIDKTMEFQIIEL